MGKSKYHEEEVLHEMSRCVHFRGIQCDPCAGGVNMRELVGGPDFGWATRIPCLLMDAENCTVVCDKRKLPTREEAEAKVTRSEERHERVMKVLTGTHEHAKAQGYGRSKGGKDSLPCPSGCGGTVHYSVASLNGHIWGKCTTEGCVSWME